VRLAKAELEALLRRMHLPYMRRAAPEVLATALSQRWDPAEVLKVLLGASCTKQRSASGGHAAPPVLVQEAGYVRKPLGGHAPVMRNGRRVSPTDATQPGARLPPPARARLRIPALSNIAFKGSRAVSGLTHRRWAIALIGRPNVLRRTDLRSACIMGARGWADSW